MLKTEITAFRGGRAATPLSHLLIGLTPEQLVGQALTGLSGAAISRSIKAEGYLDRYELRPVFASVVVRPLKKLLLSKLKTFTPFVSPPVAAP